MRKLHGKPIRFCRWGGLSSVNQRGYDASMPTFHCPPCRRGIYAFVWPYIETFLLTGYNEENQHKWQAGIKMEDFGEGLEEFETEHCYLKKPRQFDYTGELWHHLKEHVHPPLVIETKGSWIKTSFEVYVDALAKDLHSMKRRTHTSSLRGTNNPTYGYAKDHLEVFIEKVP
jgi:hypothetical protein